MDHYFDALIDRFLVVSKSRKCQKFTQSKLIDFKCDLQLPPHPGVEACTSLEPRATKFIP